jgi:hypothetical protein
MIAFRTIGILCIALAAGCDSRSIGEEHKSSAQTPVRFVVFSPQHISPIYGGPKQPSFQAIKTLEQWEAFWKLIEPQRFDANGNAIFTPKPTIDFSRQTLLVAAIGERGSNSSVSIESVVESTSNLLVTIRNTTPGSNCLLTLAVERPMSLAMIPKTSKQVDFKVKKETRNCG